MKECRLARQRESDRHARGDDIRQEKTVVGGAFVIIERGANTRCIAGRPRMPPSWPTLVLMVPAAAMPTTAPSK
jgi:hypothetical protein